ncbi:hypothetical protein SK128_028397 [Halocaridina rubra]|uniref:Uncharacterized protein n=1 Tax=Halocaridina rubra TaxID=373956 RepID=A0AAN9ABZ9_HALRR
MASGIRRRKTDHPQEVKRVVKKMFTPGYKFPLQETDDNLKVNVGNLASFGDIKDASRTEPQNEDVSGTIIGYICTVRAFYPGNYKVTVIKPYNDDRQYHINDPLVIFHHENVDPNLLVHQVIRLSEDYCEFHNGFKNSINRYDWCHWTHFGSSVDNPEEMQELDSEEKSDFTRADKTVMSVLSTKLQEAPMPTIPLPNVHEGYSRTLIYFTRTEKAEQLTSCILKNKVVRSSTIKNMFAVQDGDGETISLGIYYTPFNSGDWEYAKAFQDSSSGSYFALILNGYLSLSEGPWMDMYDDKDKKKLKFTTVDKTDLKFPINRFLVNDN